MKTTRGDLIALAKQGHFDVICHGANCFCTMGAGIAKAIRSSFPEAYSADCKTIKGDKSKLGSCTYAECKIGQKTLFVVNAYTQYDYRGVGTLVDYNAVRSCMKWIKQKFSGKIIGLPMIGAGLARGNWDIIHKIIVDELQGENVIIVEFG